MEKTPSTIRILLADDHPVVREGMAMILKYEPDMEVIGLAANGRETFELYQQHQPDVVLIDLRMPDVDGVTATAAILKEHPAARILVLTTFDGDEDIYAALRAGAKGYLLKGLPVEELLRAIRSIHAGRKHIPPEVAQKLAERVFSDQLTDRETEVLRLIVGGLANAEIAERLFVTEGTVKFHITRIFSKLGVEDRTQAAILAIKRGIARL